MNEPCGNENCDRCYQLPRWKLSEHRVQHLTYVREIKAATAEEARAIFDRGTSWPSQYDDEYGEIVQRDDVVVERLDPEEQEFECFHEVAAPMPSSLMFFARTAYTPPSPLPMYAGYEEMCGRLRAFVPEDLFLATGDRSGHDPGDETTSGLR